MARPGRPQQKKEYEVPCPKCGAEVGRRCVSLSIGVENSQFHRDRELAAGTRTMGEVGPLPRGKKLPEDSPRRRPCPRCGAEAMELCINGATGSRMAAYHAARHRPVPEPVPSCPRPVVACWIKGCKNDPRRCEFCGVCEDPECELDHRPRIVPTG